VKFLFGLLLFSAAAFAQDAIPLGTILPVQLNSSLNSRRTDPGKSSAAGSCRMCRSLPEEGFALVRKLSGAS